MSSKAKDTGKEFRLCNLADDLLEKTIVMCGKDRDKKGHTLRYPSYLYDTYVYKILETVIAIHEDIIVANETRVGDSARDELQKDAMRKCIHVEHLIRISFKFGWISTEQADSWQKLVASVRWSVYNWNKKE